MRNKIIGFFIILFLASCGEPSIVLSLEHQFDNGIWNKFQELKWELKTPDGQKPLHLTLEAEIDDNFTAESLNFQLITESQAGETLNQAFELPIDSFSISPDKLDDIKKISISLKNAGTFNLGTSYSIELVSLMPYLDTPGIQKISLVFKN